MHAIGRPCLVLLPGLLCDSTVWQGQIDALAPVADCVVPDYGERSSLVEMARGVLDAVPAPQFSVVGHSMGGRVALEIARLAPERVQRLALLDSGVDPLPAGSAGDAERAKRMALVQTAHDHGMRRMGQEWARGMVHPAQIDTPLFDAILQMIERKTPAVFSAQIAALLARPDAAGVLARLACPVLLACGRQDAWSPLSRHEAMQQLCAGSRLVVVEDSGHMSPMEQPQAVSRALAEWLAVPPTSAAGRRPL